MTAAADDEDVSKPSERSKLQLLFVDDEEKVLQGLRSRLRKHRKEWDMRFAHGGEAALEALASHEFDVIISDMRMPGVNGLAVLKEAMRSQPGAVRIILSGFTEKSVAFHAIPIAHQYLAKPTDSDTLYNAIHRARTLVKILNSDDLRIRLGRLESLPAPPAVYGRVVELTRNPDSTLADIANAIKADAGLSAKMLQIVNSAFFGASISTADITKAVRLLGRELILGVVVGLQEYSRFEGQRFRRKFDVDAQRQHSFRVGSISRQIMSEIHPELAEQAMAAGLLHNIGQLALHLRSMTPITPEVPEVEHDEGPGYDEVGAYLLGLWGLPNLVVEAVAFHQRPNIHRGSTDMCLSCVVHIANTLCHANSAEELDVAVADLRERMSDQPDMQDQVQRWRSFVEAA